MTQIARLAGVSQPTVSHVVNGRWRENRISPATCRRVARLLRRHHYRPNHLVQCLRTGRTSTVALMVPGLDVFFAEVIRGAEAAAKAAGYHVLLSHVRAAEDEPSELEILLQRRVDGFLITPRWNVKASRLKYRQLLQEKIPLVCVNDYSEEMPCSAVVADDLDGAYQATRHLIRLGHRRIAHLAGNPGPNVGRRRRDGYCQALAEQGFRIRRDYIQGFQFGAASAYEGMRRLLALKEPPTAVFGATDYHALGAIKAAFEANLRVPQDLAVVGFSDHLQDVWFDKFGLTTVHTDPHLMGKEAMAVLLEEIRNPTQRKRVRKLPVRLIVRDSCGARGGARGRLPHSLKR